jgi:protein phosphatase
LKITFASAISSSQGARRYQEDVGLVWSESGAMAESDPFLTAQTPPLEAGHLIAVLGDGMGGHVGGATASRLACEAFIDAFAREDKRSSERLLDSLGIANAALTEKIASRPMFKGMGTTLIGAHFSPAGLSWISVGDSLLFLWRRGDLARLNEDHSMAPELDRLAEAGKMSHAQAQADPRRHYLRSAVTGEDIELVDVALKPLELTADDIILLSSDGIHTLEETTIAEIVGRNAASGPQAVVDALIGTVDAIGNRHQDNTTVIAVQIGAAMDIAEAASTE